MDGSISCPACAGRSGAYPAFSPGWRHPLPGVLGRGELILSCPDGASPARGGGRGTFLIPPRWGESPARGGGGVLEGSRPARRCFGAPLGCRGQASPGGDRMVTKGSSRWGCCREGTSCLPRGEAPAPGCCWVPAVGRERAPPRLGRIPWLRVTSVGRILAVRGSDTVVGGSPVGGEIPTVWGGILPGVR